MEQGKLGGRPVRLVAWNVLAGGGTRVPSIAAALLERDPDVVVLGEFHGNRSGRELAWLLERGGLVHQIRGSLKPGQRSLLVASRLPLVPEPFPEWPEAEVHRLVCTRVGSLRLLGTYFPSKAPHIAEMFLPLLQATERLRSVPTLLLGDLNAGQNPADTEGSALTAGHRFAEMLGRGWRDLWRERNPDAKEYTWYSQRARNGFRLDHALLLYDGPPPPFDCRYDHTVRGQGLSDHSLLDVEVEL